MEQRSREDHNHQGSTPRRLKLGEGQMPPPHPSQPQPPPPQKCPRCDSLNTKFCYYNNYSLSQPRYFCKTCRRYWTQGGTLRNVPVGGGCRKGKRPKTSSSSTSTSTGDNILRSLQLPLPLPLTANQQQLQLPPHITSMAEMVSTINSGLPSTTSPESRRNTSWGGDHAPTSCSLYPTAGTLFSSLAGMHSLTQPQGNSIQPINLVGIGAGSSTGANLPIFQGFDFPLSMKPLQVQTQLQMHQSSGSFQGMGEHEKDEEEPFYQEDENNLVGQPAAARTLNSWNHAGNNNDANPTTSSLNFWNNSRGSTSSGMAGSSANAKQWPNLPGFGSSP